VLLICALVCRILTSRTFKKHWNTVAHGCTSNQMFEFAGRPCDRNTLRKAYITFLVGVIAIAMSFIEKLLEEGDGKSMCDKKVE
jgi:hypothetical protein